MIFVIMVGSRKAGIALDPVYVRPVRFGDMYVRVRFVGYLHDLHTFDTNDSGTA